MLLDGKGATFLGRITEIKPEHVLIEVTETVQARGEPDLEVILVQALAKGDRMDTVVRKATEIGVTKIVPIISERVVARPEPPQAFRRRERWQRIAVEATEQCGRSRVPEIHLLVKFEEALASIPQEALLLFFWEEEKQVTLKKALRSRSPGEQVYIFIGPEGGFAEREASAAVACGAVTVSLGPRLLRTDTAGPLAAGLVLYEWGDLG